MGHCSISVGLRTKKLEGFRRSRSAWILVLLAMVLSVFGTAPAMADDMTPETVDELMARVPSKSCFRLSGVV